MPFLSTSQFWQLKISQPPVHDLVLAGSSRVFLAVSPRHMARVMPGRSIYNFGFVACSLDSAYLEHASRLLDPGSDAPSMVLCVSPQGFMRRTRTNENFGYLYWSSQPTPNHRLLLKQIARDNLWGIALARSAGRNISRLLRREALGGYCCNGWEASLARRRDPDDYAHRYEQVYKRQAIDLDMVEEFLDSVQSLQRRGISVFGFRPPGEASMRRVEDLRSGVDFAELARRFDSAGGTWLAVDETRFPTYDGVHMGYKSARRFSRHLARLIAEAERS
ncbi:hypothetical protein [Desulfoferula mesophila]|uniref:SGNH/GDSL hydrolase family protein n=1 Tax=Desulfoferula mesophila TaxID=3058419 RepID=A0AAU9F1T7_9BACT|nr:hypothetical protein FAK_24280 [Desulfoferula mesophilus]